MTESVVKRRKPKGDTARAKAKRACERHLQDLRRAHDEPPADAAVSARGLPKFVAPILEQSYCTSPAALCAELAAEPPADAVVSTRSAPEFVAPILKQPHCAAPAALSAELAAEPPPDIAVPTRSAPEFVAPIPEQPLSAELADLAEEAGR